VNCSSLRQDSWQIQIRIRDEFESKKGHDHDPIHPKASSPDGNSIDRFGDRQCRAGRE